MEANNRAQVRDRLQTKKERFHRIPWHVLVAVQRPMVHPKTVEAIRPFNLADSRYSRVNLFLSVQSPKRLVQEWLTKAQTHPEQPSFKVIRIN
jgi:hypothetical protein